jgi:hypothetical protein
MSMVLRTVDHLNQAKAEPTDNERCAIKTETGIPGTANEEGTNSSSIQERVIMPRRSKRVPKGPCLGLAEDPIQNNSSEYHEEEDCELPVHTTDTLPQRKRKSSAASSDASTRTPRSRKKLKADKDKSTQSNAGFDEWCDQFIRFKDEFGHCNVPSRYADNPGLGYWCVHMRTAYKNIQKGKNTNSNLSQGRIERLEEIGFQWKGVDHDDAFEKRCSDLTAFNEEHGHCNVPAKCANNPSLGRWCSNMRKAYKKIQKGIKANSNLWKDRIERLEEIGFQWKGVYNHDAFEKRCSNLTAFKEEHGHCHVPRRYADNPSLGHWCSEMRKAYKKIQKGIKANSNLSQGRIERLEEIGFQWKGRF